MNNVGSSSVRISGGSDWGLLRICRSLIPSLTSLLLILYVFGSLMLNGWIKPITQRGFFCGDSSISYPFKKDTITLGTLLFFALFVPSILIKLCDKHLNRLLETFSVCSKSTLDCTSGRRRKDSDVAQVSEHLQHEEEGLITNGVKIKRRNLILNEDDSDFELIDSESSREQKRKDELSDEEDELTLFKASTTSEDRLQRKQVVIIPKMKFTETQLFIFGLATTMLFTGVGKLAGGRFRPHFMQRCQPDIDCSLPANANRYIVQFTCTNKHLEPKDFSYITTSWPSGHASTIFYSMLYLIAYLNTVIPLFASSGRKRSERKFVSLFLYSIDVLLVGLAGYISMTRISDYHHHPLDVLSGSLIGSIIAVVIFRTLSLRNLSYLVSHAPIEP